MLFVVQSYWSAPFRSSFWNPDLKTLQMGMPTAVARVLWFNFQQRCEKEYCLDFSC